ncbi:hypothetical protein TNCV_4360981 [Trichonephila clavipes]|nr:hypothetical protein TNCV_4360981 [Trichonephila clavipes]
MKDDFLQHIVVGDEIWCHHLQPAGKFVSVMNVQEFCFQVPSFCPTMQGRMSSRCASGHLPVKSGKSWNIQLTVQNYRLATKGLMGQRYHTDDGIKDAFLNWFHDQPTSFFTDGGIY